MRILVLGNSNLVVFRFRKELIRRFIREKHDVWAAFPNGPFGEGEKIAKEFGCNFVETKMSRWGTSFIQDIKLLWSYIRLIKRIRPDVVLAYTVKPDIYGGIACRLCGTPFMPNITGLGKGLDEGGMISGIISFLYRLALCGAKCVFFQNEHDRDFFHALPVKYEDERLIPGSGVNLEEFVPIEYPRPGEPLRFIYIARVMKTKGIEQYLEAAVLVKKRHKDTEFHVCGYCEEDYRGALKKCQDDGVVIYHGLVEDTKEYIARSHCIVLPTFHPEGISNVLLEGAACARPIITTDRPGCRETVDDGTTGYLIKEKDSADLVEKLERFIALSHREKMEMGLAGRRKIERGFDRNIVVDEYLRVIGNCVKA